MSTKIASILGTIFNVDAERFERWECLHQVTNVWRSWIVVMRTTHLALICAGFDRGAGLSRKLIHGNQMGTQSLQVGGERTYGRGKISVRKAMNGFTLTKKSHIQAQRPNASDGSGRQGVGERETIGFPIGIEIVLEMALGPRQHQDVWDPIKGTKALLA
jgi:hypothetical protein